jgi:hypothetical protein
MLVAPVHAPHTTRPRHTAAMRLLHAGVDTSVIALWLGHEDIRSTQMYLHADLTIKERALARTAPASVPPGRYRPADPLLAFLEGLLLCRPRQRPELAEARLVGIIPESA